MLAADIHRVPEEVGMIGLTPSKLFLEILDLQSASVNNALQCADRNDFRSVNRHDHLHSIVVLPFLMATSLLD